MDENVRARLAPAWPAMCARLAAGDLIRDILKDAGFDRNQVSAYKLAFPPARAQWDEAREASADSFHDEALDAARADVDKELAQHVRTRIDTLKWAARIRNPRLYGDKAQLDVNVRTVDLTAIIRDANARLIAQQQGRVIDVNSGNVSADTRALSFDGLLPAELAALI